MALTDFIIMPGTDYQAACDKLREKSGKKDPIRSGDLASEIEAVAGEKLPSAEESAFGVDTADEEYGIVNFGSPKDETTASGNKIPCIKYTANEDISIVGLRVYTVFYNYTRTLRLYNANSELVRETASITPIRNAWTTAYFDEPIYIANGESFIVSSSAVQYPSSSGASSVTINGKITFEGSTSTGLQAEFMPYTVYGIDVVIAPVQAELSSNYRINRTTLDDIATEAQRITGATGKLSLAQIQSGLESVVLQEKTVTPTTDQQEVVPDDGYYGLRKVTVGAVEESGGGSMFASSAVGILPTVYKGTASSEFTLNFESSATGALSE